MPELDTRSSLSEPSPENIFHTETIRLGEQTMPVSFSRSVSSGVLARVGVHPFSQMWALARGQEPPHGRWIRFGGGDYATFEQNNALNDALSTAPEPKPEPTLEERVAELERRLERHEQDKIRHLSR